LLNPKLVDIFTIAEFAKKPSLIALLFLLSVIHQQFSLIRRLLLVSDKAKPL